MLFDDMLMMDDGAVVADAFQRHQVTLGDVRGVELHTRFAIGICLDLWIPIERGSMVRARLLAFVRVLRRIELDRPTIA